MSKPNFCLEKKYHYAWKTPCLVYNLQIWIILLIGNSNVVLAYFIGLVGRVIANGPGDLGSIPGRVIPKNLKMVPNTSLLNTQYYKVCIKGKVEQSRERSSALPYTSL